ncbi:MAG TPA: hypothetical protein VKF36_15730 [Syntrophorhabdales bacterium]|nr:hypothetical protein [Syntrophorhabdales bacterium]
MSVSDISTSTNIYQDRMSQIQSVRQDLSSLTTTLASGDLTGAQNAFGTLMQDIGSTNAQSGQQTGTTSQISTDLTALGAALNAKDLTTAQSTYATLLQDLQVGQQTQKAHHHHHHHHASDAQSTTDTLNTDLKTLGTALQSGDLTTAQSAYATLMQDIGNTATQSATTTSSTSTQTVAASQSSSTSALVDALQTANGTSQNGSVSSVNTLLQALQSYAQVGQFLSLPLTTGLFAAIG